MHEGEGEDDLHATAESIAADAERLIAIEAEKRDLTLDDPKLPALSDEAKSIATDLAAKTAAETSIVEEAAETKP